MPSRDLGDVTVRALSRPGAGSALLAALGVYLVFVVPQFASTLLYIASYSDPLSYGGLILPASFVGVLVPPLPLALGVFLAFWQVAPIAPQLRMAHVVSRAVLTAVLGSAFSGVVTILVGFGTQISLTATRFPSLGDMARSVQSSIIPTVGLLFDALVAVPLAALLLWGWLQSHPPRSTARGALDEV